MNEPKEIHYHYHYYGYQQPSIPRYTGPWWGIYPPTYTPCDPNWIYNPTWTTTTTTGEKERLQKTTIKSQES